MASFRTKEQSFSDCEPESEMDSSSPNQTESSQSSKCRTSKCLSQAQLLWHQIVGSKDRECIPSNRLPTNRVIMQRYRTMRMKLQQNTQVRTFAVDLQKEIAEVWEKANIPMKTEKATKEAITRLLNSWTKFSRSAHKCKPGSDKYDKYHDILGELFDIAAGDEEQLKDLMRSSKQPT